MQRADGNGCAERCKGWLLSPGPRKIRCSDRARLPAMKRRLGDPFESSRVPGRCSNVSRSKSTGTKTASPGISIPAVCRRVRVSSAAGAISVNDAVPGSGTRGCRIEDRYRRAVCLEQLKPQEAELPAPSFSCCGDRPLSASSPQSRGGSEGDCQAQRHRIVPCNAHPRILASCES